MIAFIYGTRPEAVKISAVVHALRELGHEPVVLCTGQHTDLLGGTPADTILADAENLRLDSGGNVRDYLAVAQPQLEKALRRINPSYVAVQGDTMSVLAGARAAVACQIPVCHIEAGVRSWADEPWPEEVIRRHVTSLAEWHYAHSVDSLDNLEREQIDPEFVLLTGNPGISALWQYTDARPRDAVGHTIVITLHRRELRDKGLVPDLVTHLVRAIKATPNYTFLWPVHPAMRAFLPKKVPANLILSEPIPYAQMLQEVSEARGVLTDSGGLVEEAATLGVPTVILRHHNDRPEAEFHKVARRIDPEDVCEAVRILVAEEIRRMPMDIYGTADSAQTIAEHLAMLDTDGL